MSYSHRDKHGNSVDLPTGKVICVGRNYMDHIRELNNEVPDEAVLFMKPASSLCLLNEPLLIPQGFGEVHNELEIAVLIGKPLSHAKPDEVEDAVWVLGLGLDLTLRDVQTKLKQKGLPWERAKAFDAACPVSHFEPLLKEQLAQPQKFSLVINDEIRQSGDSVYMMRDIPSLLVQISQLFRLEPGDIVMTGTPKGVGPLNSGDKLTIEYAGKWTIETHVNVSGDLP